MISSDVVSVPSNAAAAIATSVRGDAGGQSGGSVLIEFSAAGTIYLGGSAVTSVIGFVWDGTPISVQIEDGETLYGRAASGTISVTVLKQGV